MKTLRIRWSTLSVLALLTGCAGRAGSPPVEAPVPPPPTTDSRTAPAALEVAAAPEGLVLVGRWQAPAESLDLLLGWTGLPLDWRGLADQNLPRSTAGTVRDLLALDSPLDFAVTLPRPGEDPEPRLAFAIGVHSLDGTLELAETLGASVEPLRDEGRRVYRLELDGELECMLGPALGTTSARLVCGEGYADVTELFPYLSRGLPLEQLGTADLHVELRVEPLRRLYGPTMSQAGQVGLTFLLRELAFDDPRLDRAIADTARGLLGEGLALMEDVDRAWTTLDLDASSSAARATLGVEFRQSTSWSAHTINDAAPRASVAPDAFWALPHDAPAASYAVASNSERTRALRRQATELLDAFLAYGGLPDRLRKDVSDLVQKPFPDAPVVVVQGSTPPRDGQAASAGNETASPRWIGEALDQLGWQIRGVEGPAKDYVSYFDAWTRVYRDPAVTRLLETKLPRVDRKLLPKLRAEPAGVGLPAGSRRYVLAIALPKGEGEKGTTRTLTLLVVPDGERTWLGFSPDEKVLRAELAKVLAPGARTLRDRAGLEALRREPSQAAGFVTLRTTLEASLARLLGLSAPAMERTFSAMPAGGKTPMLTALRLTPGQGPRLEWSLAIPRAVVQDVAVAIPTLLANSSFGAGAGSP